MKEINNFHENIENILLGINNIKNKSLYNICFDNDTKFMAVSSNKGTIHIFSLKSTIQKLKKLEEKKKRKRK